MGPVARSSHGLELNAQGGANAVISKALLGVCDPETPRARLPASV